MNIYERKAAKNFRRNKRKNILKSVKQMNKKRTTDGQFEGLCQRQGRFISSGTRNTLNPPPPQPQRVNDD